METINGIQYAEILGYEGASYEGLFGVTMKKSDGVNIMQILGNTDLNLKERSGLSGSHYGSISVLWIGSPQVHGTFIYASSFKILN